MAEINEEFSRLFFEHNNFLVRTNIKYYVRKDEQLVGGDSDIDLVIFNLNPNRKNPAKNFVLKVDDLNGIEYAIVESKGWHTETFNFSKIKSSPRIFNFVRKEAIEAATDLFKNSNFKKILVCSSLPVKESGRTESINLLKKGGIDHVIEFKTIVDKLWSDIEEKKSYDSGILQTIRLIKKYRKN